MIERFKTEYLNETLVNGVMYGKIVKSSEKTLKFGARKVVAAKRFRDNKTSKHGSYRKYRDSVRERESVQAESSDGSDTLMESTEDEMAPQVPVKKSKHTPSLKKQLANRAKFTNDDTTDYESEAVTRI